MFKNLTKDSKQAQEFAEEYLTKTIFAILIIV